MWGIVKDGHFFRAVNSDGGKRSQLFTSPSQAGHYIRLKAGDTAYDTAVTAFMTKEYGQKESA